MLQSLQILLHDDVKGFADFDTTTNRTSTSTIWDPVTATFRPQALKYVASIPLIIAGCIAIGQIIRLRFRRKLFRPEWLRNIIDSSPDTLQPVDKSTRKRFDISSTSALIIFTVLGAVIQVSKLLINQPVIESCVILATWVVLWAFIAIKRSRISSPLLLVNFFSILVVELIIWLSTSDVLHVEFILNILSVLCASIASIIVLRMPMYDPRLSTAEISAPYTTPTKTLRSPEDNLTLWQFLTVAWMEPLISTAYSRQLHEEDVWLLGYEFLHRPLHEKFKELSGSLVIRLLKANGLDIVITSLLGLIELLGQLSTPVILQQLLRSMQDPASPRSATIKYAAVILAARLVVGQAGVLQTWYSRRAYERSRGEMITTLYQKTLSRKISMVGTGEIIDDPTEMAKRLSASKGKIFNLMRGDCYNVAQRFWEIPPLIQKPIGLVLSIVLIWKIIGWPCLLGMITVLAAQAINAVIIQFLYKLEQRRRAITDAKLQRTSSLVEAIRHLRWYGWQNAWLENIMEARQRELNMRVLTGFLGVCIGFTNMLGTAMFTVVAFAAYTEIAHLRLTVDIAFPALTLLSMLGTNLREIPELIKVFLEASVAISRLNEFMNEEDKPIDKAASTEQLRFEEASFAWPGTSHAVLRHLTVAFPTGLTLITGKVGAGKTALLNAVMGELDLTEGNFVCPEGSVAYCAQIPWLESKSIRDNILFALPYDEVRYKQVVSSCALLADFIAFKDGDLTMIGENGVGLSGGQRARCALARAIYSPAAIVLLDDPISALDRPTTSHIIRECIGGSLLQDRTVLFVSHQPELFHGLVRQTVDLVDGQALLYENLVVSSHDTSFPLKMNGHATKAQNNVKEDEPVADNFMESEHRSYGGIKLSVYWAYVKAGRFHWWVIFAIVVGLARLCSLLELWFLKEWGEAYKDYADTAPKTPLGFLRRLPSPDIDVTPWLLVYLVLNVTEAFLSLAQNCVVLLITYVAGKKMFRQCLERVTSSTFRFLDVTPVGRLMNRLTGDINTIDGGISNRFQSVAQLVIRWTSSLIVIASITPSFLILSFCLMAAFVAIFLRFLPTSQTLRRLEMVSLSPLMSDFGALLDGLLTVRAFGVQQRFQDRLIEVVDNFQGMDHFYWSLQTWLQYRFDILSSLSGFLLVILAVYTNVSPGLTAFALIAANQLIVATHRLCKRYGQLQMDFVSVERVVELLDLEQEDPGTVTPPAYWPSQTHGITFDNLTIRYASHLPPALSNISFHIRHGAKVALIGRTGCGKTTLALSLLSTLAPETGGITLDGLDIATVDKQILRSRVTFLAQEPVLFPGTMRQNLDPILEHSDADCEDVLLRVGGRSYGWTLATHVESRGANLSLGQRQLVSLARALLRRSSVIIMDEATASVDSVTEAMVHRLIKSELAGSIVLTIAHRVDAIKEADWVVVLDKGRVLRQGTPEEILEDEETARRLGEDLGGSDGRDPRASASGVTDVAPV